MVNKKYPFTYLVLSDIHLGHRSTKADEILDHLTVFFNDFRDTELSEIDAIFIAGDLFDMMIQVASDVVNVFVPWFFRLLNFCSKHDIVLRILEGTPSHDRRQGHLLAHIAENVNLNVDFKYIPTLSIEYIERFGRHVLYVPDECRPTAAEIQEDTDKLLAEHNLQQVDLAIMHGHFAYQLGRIPKNNSVLDERFFLDRVKGFINIGHIHTRSAYERIIAQGSFDRLAHGEEEAKGGCLVKETENESLFVFLDNKQAKIYKTIKVPATLEESMERIDRVVSKLPFGSHVRIQAKNNHPLFQAFETLVRKYPLFTFTKKTKSEEEEVVEVKVELSDYKPVILNQDTIIPSLLSEIKTNHALSDREINLVKEMLFEVQV